VKDPNAPTTVAVIDKGIEGRNAYLLGSIPKIHVKALLVQRAFENPEGTYSDTSSIRKFKTEPKFDFTPDEMQKTVDLKPYINMATFAVQEHFPLNLGYRIFRNHGLRQMYVIDHHNNLIGVLLRENLMLHDGGHGSHMKHVESKGLLSAPSEEDLKGLDEVKLEEMREEAEEAVNGEANVRLDPTTETQLIVHHNEDYDKIQENLTKLEDENDDPQQP